jgi:hypothetical protein
MSGTSWPARCVLVSVLLIVWGQEFGGMGGRNSESGGWEGGLEYLLLEVGANLGRVRLCVCVGLDRGRMSPAWVTGSATGLQEYLPKLIGCWDKGLLECALGGGRII